jgi:hypothetical protein
MFTQSSLHRLPPPCLFLSESLVSFPERMSQRTLRPRQAKVLRATPSVWLSGSEGERERATTWREEGRKSVRERDEARACHKISPEARPSAVRPESTLLFPV